jgi:2-deoxy-D-gluconate 3-dehydrogenase
MLASRRLDKLAKVVSEITSRGGQAEAFEADVTRSDDLARLSRHIADRAERSDVGLVLVNNAGFGFTKPALETTETDWDQIFATHVKGTFFCSQAIAPLMIQRGYGKIINMSSTWSRSTDSGKAAYSVAKGAVSRITAALSSEWAPQGVRVNALAPTTTATEFTSAALKASPERAERLLSKIKLGRYATVDDLVGPAIFLASEASDFITGHTLFVDGGWSAAA